MWVTGCEQADGRVTSQSWDGAVVARVSYDAHFDLASVAYPTGAGNGGNGTSLTVGRDAEGRTDSLTATGPGGTLTSDQVASGSGSGYSQSGRVVAERVDATSGAATSTFAYDTAGRVTDASVATGGGGSSTLRYVYGTTAGCAGGAMVDPGADSNRSAVTIDGATTDYCYGPGDRLTSTSGAAAVGAVGYDVHGNTNSLGGDSYTKAGYAPPSRWAPDRMTLNSADSSPSTPSPTAPPTTTTTPTKTPSAPPT
jgi:hypothetical protein